MSVIQVGLVDTTGALDPTLLQATAAALNVQVLRDLTQYWNVHATVRYLPDPKSIPVGVWPVRLVASLPPGEGGVHLDKKNQPYSLVIAIPARATSTPTASKASRCPTSSRHASSNKTSKALTKFTKEHLKIVESAARVRANAY